MSDTTYTIQMASKISGVGVHTIRAWEKRYKALIPVRDASGHRTYTKSDVEKLMLLSELCLLGYTISKVATLSSDELKDQLKSLGKTEESLASQDFNLIRDTKPTMDPSQSFPILNFALRSYNLDVINIELTKLKSILPARDFALQILLPLYEAILDYVRNGALSPSQEKAAVLLLKFHMGHGLYHPAEKKEKGSVNAVIAGIEGDDHDFLLGLSGLLCGHYGFHYTYLGTNVPYDSVLDIVKSFNANLLIIGPVTRSVGKSQCQQYMDRIFSKLSDSVNVLLACDQELERVSSKRLVQVKDLDAVDRYLDHYLSKN